MWRKWGKGASFDRNSELKQRIGSPHLGDVAATLTDDHGLMGRYISRKAHLTDDAYPRPSLTFQIKKCKYPEFFVAHQGSCCLSVLCLCDLRNCAKRLSGYGRFEFNNFRLLDGKRTLNF